MPLQVIYSARSVPIHGRRTAGVVLMNEAPGPDEDDALIPLYGQQGANLYHGLRLAEIGWAMVLPKFVWSRRMSASSADCQELKNRFLQARGQHIRCTNAYDRWPRPAAGRKPFCKPGDDEVLAEANIARIRAEIGGSEGVMLVCGDSAYLACLGYPLDKPRAREGSLLAAPELARLNQRLGTAFSTAWYLGHTRRWSFYRPRFKLAMMAVARAAGWPLADLAGR